jgi:hypothetical protein
VNEQVESIHPCILSWKKKDLKKIVTRSGYYGTGEIYRSDERSQGFILKVHPEG